MQQPSTIRRMSARTALAVALAAVGMLALGGAWSSATATPCSNNGNATGQPGDDEAGKNKGGDKTPPGQSDNDKNKGHECDGNNGIAKGNPAHPGCGGGDNIVDDSGCEGACGGGTTTTTNTTVVGEGEQPETEVLGLTEERPAAPAAATPAAAAPGELARTGAKTQTLGLLGLALLAFGGSAILLARRDQETVFPLSA